jgi:hypothetical protein
MESIDRTVVLARRLHTQITCVRHVNAPTIFDFDEVEYSGKARVCQARIEGVLKGRTLT